jgi:spermidine/putrescine transport system ATP-binding protein
MDGFIELCGIRKVFPGQSVPAVDHASLTLKKGEVFSLLGPSGCGKTTLLRILGGFEVPDEGRILIDGKDVTDLPPNQRSINTVFQNYALFPHLSLWDNVAFGLKMAKKPKKFIEDEVDRMLDMVDLLDQADKKPHQISGGQKQRVAIARALINKPQLLLLDEPLAALDLKLRQRMLLELDRIHDEVGITFLYVTHDQGEAMSLSDRIAVMNRGKIEQIGRPMEVYEAPSSSFVAAFIGDTNFFRAKVVSTVSEDYSMLAVDGLPEVLAYNDKKLQNGQQVYLSIRPEKFRISREAPADPTHINMMRGKILDIIYLGSNTKYRVQCDHHILMITQQHARFLLDMKPFTWDEEVWVSWNADDGYMLQRFEESDTNLLGIPPVEDTVP